MIHNILMSFEKKYLKEMFFLFLIFCLLIFKPGKAQEFVNIIGPSPSAAPFSKYGEIPVSYYSGIPNIEIPLYSIQNKNINIPISLSYHAGGFRVDEEAGRAGLGWVVNAGGVINRNVNGLDDFLPTRGYLNNSIPYFFSASVTGALQSGESIITGHSFDPCSFSVVGQSVNLCPYVPSRSDPEGTSFDMEPDTYTYSINGISGKFSIKKDRTVVQQSPNGVNIKLLNDNGTVWQILTTEGIKYIFEQYERCRFQSESGTFSDPITSWYVTRVIAPTGEGIKFNYTAEENYNIISYNSVYEKYGLEAIIDFGSNACMPSAQATKTYYPSVKSYNPVYLSSIDFPNGTVNFEYQSRIDVTGDKRLSKISIDNKENISMSFYYEFIHDYFTSQPNGYIIPDPSIGLDQNIFNKRLKLISVVKKNTSGMAEQPYYFTYKNLTLPPKNSLARDHWGFYNGKHSNTSLLPKGPFPSLLAPSQTILYSYGGDRSPSEIYCAASILSEITYPTGGKTIFDFAINDYDIANSINNLSPSSQKDLVEETKNFMTRRGTDDVFNVSFPTTYNNSTIKFKIKSQNGQEMTWPYPYSDDAVFEIYNANNLITPVVRVLLGSESFWIKENTGNPYDFRYHRDDEFLLPAGSYVVKTHIGANVLFLNYIDFSFTYQYYKDNSNNHGIEIGGGLRIAQMTNFDPVSQQYDTTKFNYHYNFDYDGNGIAEECSFGKRLTALRYTSFEKFKNCCSIDNSSHWTWGRMYNLFSQSNIPNDQVIVGYDKVKTWVSNNNGYTEYEYYNDPQVELQYNDGVTDLRPPGLHNLINLKNGLLLRETSYRFKSDNSSYQKVKEALYNYDTASIRTHLGLRLIETFRSSCEGAMGDGIYLAQYPSFQSRWNRLASQITYDYADGITTSEVKKSYEYEVDEPKHYLPVRTIINDSKNNIITTVNIYPTDYAAGNSVIDSMKASNIIMPIEQVKYTTKNGNTDIISGNIFVYRPRGIIDQELRLETDKPIISSSFKFSNRNAGIIPPSGISTTFDFDSRYKPVWLFNEYDAHGNILERQKINDTKEVHLWGYNSQYPVLKILGSELSTVLNIPSLDTSLLNNGSSAQRQAQLTLIRNYFSSNSKVQVFTYTYAPLVGMTSETDPAGRTTYYEYDSFGRLSKVKDDQGNIVKHICYNYAGQVINCNQ